MKPLVFVTAFLFFIVACAPETPPEQAAPVADAAEIDKDPVKEIAWFDGSVDEAFAFAKEQGRPLFLYWGAEWCPPCHAINATIFSKPEFIERSKLFVPVYLDGDDEDAQAYGERFGVMGYPTMVVFSADGTELTRIPSGIDIHAYASVLDLTLAASSSVRNLVEELIDGRHSLSENECSLLAYHSWGQDPEIGDDFDLRVGFRRMYEACPEQLGEERSVLYLSWLNEARSAEDEAGNPIELTDQQREEALGMLDAILDDPAMIRANIFSVILGGPTYTSLLTEPGSPRSAELTQAFMETLDSIAADDEIYKRERIYTLAGKIGFERIDDESAELSEQLKQEIRDMVAWADESTPSVYERQPVVNALANVLNDAGMDDVAKSLLLAELDKSKQPYYFMVDLADIEQRAGNYDVALDWLKQAYDSTKGPATRFQWGGYYLTGLLEMTPEDTATITDAAVTLVTELLQNTGGFYQRPKRQLQRIEDRLLEWGGEGTEAIADIRQSVLSACEALPENDASCDTFLESS